MWRLLLDFFVFLGILFSLFIIILSLNVRGLGRPEDRLGLRRLVRKQKVEVPLL